MSKNKGLPPIVASHIGLVLSVLLTVAMYVFVVNKIMSGWKLTLIVALLAIAQLIVQFRFFLHIGIGKSVRYNAVFLITTIFMASIVVFGSIWIMNNLNYNMMSPEEADQHIIDDELIAK